MAFMHGHGKRSKQTETPAAPAGEAVMNDTSPTRGESKGYIFVAIIYLLGLCMGALDMSIVNPARTVIQNTMGVEDSLGVWVLTIYTLAYAASIPVMGKLADRHGRKSIYILCILLFGGGSLICGLSHATNSFALLLFGRVIQALGGGGIMPVATAEFGTAFPEEKRGMALGVVGMVYGVASILGSSAGSALLDLFGHTEWQYIFYLNVPICLFVIIFGLIKLPNSKLDDVKPIDGLGTLLLTVLTLSLMYGLKNIDFFDFAASVSSLDVWPFLLVAVVLIPLFVWRETKAADPIINITYFKNANIVITLVCALLSGVIMMGTIFYPQFSENSMLMQSGSGGYFIALLGVGSAVGAMGSGGLIDKFGIKPVLAVGFVGCAIGSIFMAFVACEYPSMLTVCGTMLLSGLGLGFTMGTPLNYMMLQNTDEDQSNSALATMSLIRSIGTAVTPAIMVAFLMHAGAAMQDNLMAVMPTEVDVSPLPHAAELDQKLDDLRDDPDTASMLEGLDIPRLSDLSTMEVSMDGDSDELDTDVTMSDEILEKMQNSDVTTITETCKDMAVDVFSQIRPELEEKATDGMEKGISAMTDKAKELEDAIAEMDEGLDGIQTGIDKMTEQKESMEKAAEAMAAASASTGASGASSGMPADAMAAMSATMGEGASGTMSEEAMAAMAAAMGADSAADGADAGAQGASGADATAMAEALEGMPDEAAEMLASLGDNPSPADVASALQDQIDEMTAKKAEMQEARDSMQDAYDSIDETLTELNEASGAIPSLFDEAQANYLQAIDADQPVIQATYQKTLNEGFKGMALFVTVCSVIGVVLMIFYKDKRPAPAEAEGEGGKAASEIPGSR